MNFQRHWRIKYYRVSKDISRVCHFMETLHIFETSSFFSQGSDLQALAVHSIPPMVNSNYREPLTISIKKTKNCRVSTVQGYFRNGYPSMYNGGPNVFQQVGPGYNGQVRIWYWHTLVVVIIVKLVMTVLEMKPFSIQTSGQPSSYGYSSSQQFNPSNQYNGRRRR